MIGVKVNATLFKKDMDNILQYSLGFLDGVKIGFPELLESLGSKTVDGIKEFIDSSARMNPGSLHHVYEWYQTGSPDSRLFDIKYSVAGNTISFSSQFRQSNRIKLGSNQPFFDKARVMENGQSVVIRPRSSSVLAFEVDGEQVFTSNPVTVTNPGGDATTGGFERAFRSFFDKYFTQSFLVSSGLARYLSNPEAFKKKIASGKIGGRSAGISAGHDWIASIGGKV